MRIGLCIVLFVIAHGVQSQYLQAVGSGNNVLKESQYVGVDGSPYFFDDWKNGAIKDNNGKLSENVLIRYDSYRDELQFLKDGKTLAIEPAMVSEFYFVVPNRETNKLESYFFRNGFVIDGYTKLNYFQVLYNGDLQFIKKIKSEYIQETVSNFATNEQIKKFVRTEEEFLVRDDGSVVATGKNRKNIVSSLGNTSGEIKVYIKENKLNVKNDDDLVTIFRKVDELNSTN